MTYVNYFPFTFCDSHNQTIPTVLLSLNKRVSDLRALGSSFSIIQTKEGPGKNRVSTDGRGTQEDTKRVTNVCRDHREEKHSCDSYTLVPGWGYRRKLELLKKFPG